MFDSVVIASLNNITIVYSGEELRQDDEDVFMQVIDIAKVQKVGEDIKFTANSMIVQLGWTRNSSSYTRLADSIRRMKKATIELTESLPNGDKRHFGGSLVGEFEWLEKGTDVQLSQWVVSLQRNIVHLFDPQAYSLIHWPTRMSLTPTTKWLHSYYSSHKMPFPIKLETLRRIMASDRKNIRSYKATIKESLQSLVDIGFFLTAHVDPVTDLVHVERAADRKLLE